MPNPKPLTEKPNTKAVIGFIVDQPEDFWIFAPIVGELAESELIFISKGLGAKTLHSLGEIASSQNKSWRIFSGRIHDFFEQYELIIGTRLERILSDSALAHKKKVLFFEPTFGWSSMTSLKLSSRVDGVAATGPHFATLFRPFTPTAIIGSPRLEEMRHRPVPRDKSILYVPNITNPRVKEIISAVMEAVPEGYKLSMLVPTMQSTKAKDETGANGKLQIISMAENSPALAIAQSAIVILEDDTSIFDCIFFEKPIILLDTFFGRTEWDKEEQLMPLANTKEFGQKDPTLADIGVILKKPQNLPDAIKLIEQEAIIKQLTRNIKRLKKIFVSAPRGSAVKSAIAFIRSVQKSQRPPESLLARTYEAQENWAKLNQYYEMRFGAKPPYGSLTKTLIQFLSKLEK